MGWCGDHRDERELSGILAITDVGILGLSLAPEGGDDPTAEAEVPGTDTTAE